MSSKYIETRRVLGKGAFGKVIEVFSYDTGYTYAKKVCTQRGHYLDNTEFEKSIMETLMSFKRAGANGVLSYFSITVATWLRETR